jgi:hypothetical protein
MFLLIEYAALLWGTACQDPSLKFSPTSPASKHVCWNQSLIVFRIPNLYILQL